MPHNKTFTLRKPIDDMIVPVDMLLTNIARDGARTIVGTYVGTGRAGQIVSVPFYPQLIIISPLVNLGKAFSTSVVTVTGNMVFSLAANEGVSWVPGTGFKKDCILTISKDNFTIGANTNVNTAPTLTATSTYLYLILG